MNSLTPQTKIYAREQLAPVLADLKAAGKTVVFTNGCFDLVHVGHARYLRRARELGDALVVALNTDDSVRRLKGEHRPLMSQEDRAELMASLECVEYVTFFGEQTPIETIQILQPSIHVKGGDYSPETLPETPVVEAYGGKVVIMPLLAGRSTTNLIERILKAYG